MDHEGDQNADLDNAIDMPKTQVNEPTKVAPLEPPIKPFLLQGKRTLKNKWVFQLK